ncbi:hypothetical protein OPV22_010293 [Ensete ventricosum]|uniref:Amino acid transporter transmembrane domain-containing protein n=1 Tax=Ensete ventricosum TaxID=4639 RepID=A0AAV8RAX7_ENSVE|nr:hypothetical protein OPV22_010293 [Ensete ventricosum]
MGVSDEGDMNIGKLLRLFDSSNFFIDSILVAGYQGQPLADHPSVKNSRAPSALLISHELGEERSGSECTSRLSRTLGCPADDGDDEFADLYVVKWTSLMIPPLTIIMVNLIAIAVGVSRTIYNVIPQWSKLVGRVVLQLLVPCSSLPVCKRMPTMVYLWSGLIVITISLLWVKAISPPSADQTRFLDSFTALACRLTLSIDDGCFATFWIITYPLYPMRQQLWLWKEEMDGTGLDILPCFV